MDLPPPIDLPDHYDLEDDDHATRAVTLAAGAALALVAVIATLLIWVLP